MGFEAKILADSLHPSNGRRVTTFELTYPRCIHAEIMTHKMIAKNSASSRAIPVKTMLERINNDPFIPIHWGKNQKGMQADLELTEDEQESARRAWLTARDSAVRHAQYLLDLGLHKQITNRVVEPWMWITVIATGNDIGWENLFKLRCHREAEPHFQKIAYMARELFDGNSPKMLNSGEWHLPLSNDLDYNLPVEDRVKICIGRCARVSYLTHDGRRSPDEDISLFERLAASGHYSPSEHVCRIAETGEEDLGGNIGRGFVQFRKLMANECCHKAPR